MGCNVVLKGHRPATHHRRPRSRTSLLDDAIAAFTRAEQINPQDGAVQRNLAYSLYQKKDIPNALVHAERALALQPRDVDSQNLVKMLRQIRGSD